MSNVWAKVTRAIYWKKKNGRNRPYSCKCLCKFRRHTIKLVMAATNENNKVRPLYLQQPCQNDLGGRPAILLNVELNKAFITDYRNVFFFFLSWRFADMYKGALTGVFLPTSDAYTYRATE